MPPPPRKMCISTLPHERSGVRFAGAAVPGFAAQIFAALFLSAASALAAPSLILHHGRIVTVDELLILVGRTLSDLCVGIEEGADASESR